MGNLSALRNMGVSTFQGFWLYTNIIIKMHLGWKKVSATSSIAITTSKSFNPFNKQQSSGNHIYAPNSLLVRCNNRVLTCHSLEGIYSFLLKMQNVFIWNTVLLSPLFHTSEGAKRARIFNSEVAKYQPAVVLTA